MSARIDILPGIPEEEYKYEIKITEEALQSLDDEVMLTQIGSNSNLVKFYLNRKLSLEECLSVLERLEKMAGPTGSICIFSTGHNFNDLMKLIGTRNTKNHYEMHIDDNDIRNIIDVNNIICGLNFSRISCACYFSDRYLMNFKPADFIALCKIPECKFDRKRVTALRGVAERVWLRLGTCSGFHSIHQLNSLEKTEMVLDFVTQDITLPPQNLSNGLTEDIKDNQFKTHLASLLLDNYFAQVNCRVVEGTYFPTGNPETWLVTKHNDNLYGHSLLRNYRFSNLEEKGYIDGMITLEKAHQYRDDFRYDISSYSTLNEIDYFKLSSSLATKTKKSGFSLSYYLTDDHFTQSSSYDCEAYDGSKGYFHNPPSIRILLTEEKNHNNSKHAVSTPWTYVKSKINCLWQNKSNK